MLPFRDDGDDNDGHGVCELGDCARRVCVDHKAGQASTCCGCNLQGVVIDGLVFCVKPCADIVLDEMALAAEAANDNDEATPLPVIDGDETEKLPRETMIEVVEGGRR